MKLKYSFEMMKLEDSLVAVPVGTEGSRFKGVLKMNETAAKILELLKKETDEEEIVETLSREYEVPRDQLASDVHQYILKFQEKDLLI